MVFDAEVEHILVRAVFTLSFITLNMTTSAPRVEHFPPSMVGGKHTVTTLNWLVASTLQGRSTRRHVRHDVMAMSDSEVSSIEVVVYLR